VAKNNKVSISKQISFVIVSWNYDVSSFTS